MLRQPLPLEYVLIILGFLSREYDMDTMASLLRVNKTICALTLPFLYRDCFNPKMHTNRPCSKKAAITVPLLVQTLLRQVHPQDQIPGLLQVVFLSQDDQPTAEQPTPVFKYGHLIRMMDPDRSCRMALSDVCWSPRVWEYATTSELYDKYVAQGRIINTLVANKGSALHFELRRDVSRQLLWTLCQGHMDSVEELSIPLSDIERYIDHVDQFTSLTKVSFDVDKVVKISEYALGRMGQEDYDQCRKEMDIECDRLRRAMVHFVQQHTSIHQHVLRTVELPHELPATSPHSSADTWFEILSLLPPLRNPRSISFDNICKLMARLSDIDLSHVESIKLDPFSRPSYGEKALTVLCDSLSPFLSRFRALKHLETRTMGPDMFQWAVLEKKELDAKRQQESILCQHSSSWQHAYHYHNLVSLQSVRLVHNTPSKAIQELNDLTFAFSDSLKNLTIHDMDTRSPDSDAFADLSILPVVVHGCGWNLPRLRTLDFWALCSQLRFDMYALQRSNLLESLHLQDRISTFNHRDIRSWRSVNLPHLKRLTLVGSPALFFNLDSLHHSPCLEYLKLSITYMDRLYMASPEEMDDDSETEGLQDTTTDDHGLSGTAGLDQGCQSIGRRPRFTWDWDLPNLRQLELRAVFAYKFDFQWLQHLPNLQSLLLSTFSVDGNYQRDITLKDLLIGRRQGQDEDEEQKTSDEYFSLPKLEKFDLGGEWDISAEVLKVLFMIVTPNLRHIEFNWECSGFQLGEWVALVREMPRLEFSCLNREFPIEEIKELGLSTDEPEDEHEDGCPTKRLLYHELNGELYYDVLDE